MEASIYRELYNENSTAFGKNYEADRLFLISTLKANELIDYEAQICNAFDLCYNSHIGIVRASGAPYWTHPLAVSLILIDELHIKDINLIIAALLHNVLRDNEELNLNSLQDTFGSDVAELVDNLQKINLYGTYYSSTDDRNWNISKNFGRAFILLVNDVRLFMLQLCNRLHDIRTLQHLPLPKQKVIAKETLYFYIPLAYRFGFYKIQQELEELSFYYFDIAKYKHITDLLKQKNKVSTEFISIFVDLIKNILNKNNILYNIQIKHKPKYELFLEMQKGIDIYKLENIFSFKIILDTKEIKDCNKVFQILKDNLLFHRLIDCSDQPIFEVDDSISVHIFSPVISTTVNISTKQLCEINNNNNLHLQWKNNNTFTKKDITLWEKWINNITQTRDSNEAESMIWNTITANLYKTKITIYDKNNNQYFLPEGSTPIDFAFNISNEMGLSIISCKINGVIKDIFCKLKQNDIIEIINTNNYHPDTNWFNHCVSIKALSNLTTYFNEKYHNNLKSNTKINQFQAFRITCTKNINNILIHILNSISNENITRITFANNGNAFIVLIITNINMNEIRNDLFIKFMQINGVKTVQMLPNTV